METERTAPIFVSGISIREPSPKAPEYVLLQQSFKAVDFFRWCQDHMDEKGWVNITLKRSKKGSIYGELDTWKPTKTEESSQETKEYNDTKYQTSPIAKTMDEVVNVYQENINLEDIPF